MGIITEALELILHFDRYLGGIIGDYGVLTYLILFLIIFAETGLVITPFLPGDSLIFIAGTFAARGELIALLLFFILSSAAILGDTVNYWIGNYLGEKIFLNKKLINTKYLERTKDFYKKHGGKTIIFARFIPVIRTFAPFVAGVGKMDYLRFLAFNVVGGIVWVGIFVFGGYYFGKIEFVQNNLSLFIFIIIFSSVIPVFIKFLRNKKRK